MKKVLKRFIALNQTFSKKLEKYLPHAKPDITNLYAAIVSQIINQYNRPIVVDVGAGKLTPYAKFINIKSGAQIIGVDVDYQEISQNKDLSKTIITDIQKGLPFKKNIVDIITSRYVLEHLEDLDQFLKNCHKILKTNGYSIHLFSCKFALFSLLNQFLPEKISHLLLRHLVKEGNDIHGFKTYYRHCYYPEIINLFQNSGYSIEKTYQSYYQARYFSFFLPLFLLIILLEMLFNLLQIKNLAAYILIVVRKDK